MKNPALEAHQRLLASGKLKVHTHERREKLRPEPVSRPEKPYRRAVIIDGKTYPSMKEALRELGIASRTLYSWLENGKAKYVEGQ